MSQELKKRASRTHVWGEIVPHPELFFIVGSFLLLLTGTISGSVITVSISDEETVV